MALDETEAVECPAYDISALYLKKMRTPLISSRSDLSLFGTFLIYLLAS